MIVTDLKLNHIKNPMGFAIDRPVISYVVKECGGKRQKQARVEVALDCNFAHILYDSGMTEDIDSIAFELPLELKPTIKYYWRVTVVADNGEIGTSDIAWFETAKAPEKLTGAFITVKDAVKVCAFTKKIEISKNAIYARAYATALGVYELQINGKKAGNEYLTPYSNDYDSWLQYQTFDVTELLKQGENAITMTVAPGWYSGYFGFDGKNHIYGEKNAIFLNVDIVYEDGTKETIYTDETWDAKECQVRESEIYHGEIYDATFVPAKSEKVEVISYDKEKLQPRRSLPIIVKERVKPQQIITTPAGETVIDFGQNMVGWVSFISRENHGETIQFWYGETLQEGNFYRDNLRTAKAEYAYTSDGVERWIRPHFTYYGFRYVKVEGNKKELQLDDFVGEVVYSDMELTGTIETSNPLVNRLALNALWGQKGNFVDVPTDCPQRDERMGWTGDAQVFSGTAAFFMDVSPFYAKYGYDMMREQEKYEGCVPMVIPSFHMGPGGSAAWADAATVIPWITYLYSGDSAILEQQYPSMKMWVDYMHKQDEENGSKGLLQTGFHFGDWLAPDGTDPKFPTGATDPYYVASAYYYLSTTWTAKAAAVIGRMEDAMAYEKLAAKIKMALQNTYFSADGALDISTQTGYVLALAFDFCPEEYKEKLAADLNQKLEADGGRLMTGFVGTPYLCKVLSEYGYHERAFQLLLNEECPSWLYAVKMGATTIWERWDSILPDGKMNPEGMNSLNHYAYGAIAEWMFRYIGGINPIEQEPGFRHILLKPIPDSRMEYAEVTYDSPVGTYKSKWEIKEGTYYFSFTIPFGGSATLILPKAPKDEATMELVAGTYEINYVPTEA